MKRSILFAIGMLMASFLVAAVPSAAQAKASPVICPAGDSGKIDTTGDPQSVTVTAPDGYLVSGYCAKGGQQTDFVTVDPPQKTVTITVSNGKAVSHYSVTYTEDRQCDPYDDPYCS